MSYTYPNRPCSDNIKTMAKTNSFEVDVDMVFIQNVATQSDFEDFGDLLGLDNNSQYS